MSCIYRDDLNRSVSSCFTDFEGSGERRPCEEHEVLDRKGQEVVEGAEVMPLYSSYSYLHLYIVHSHHLLVKRIMEHWHLSAL